MTNSMTNKLQITSEELLKSSMDKRQVLINSNTQVVPPTKVSRTRLVICMVLGNSPGQTVVNIMDNGMKTSCMALAALLILMGHTIEVNL